MALLVLTGHEEMIGRLHALDARLRESIGVEAVSAAAQPMEAAIIDAAPVGPTGNLAASIRTRIGSKDGGKLTVAVIGPSFGRAPHRHLVIRGTKERFQKSGKSVGRMPANPFVDRAFARARQASESALVGTLMSALAREGAL